MKKVFSFVFATIIAISMPLSAFAQSTTATKYTKEDTATVQQAFEKNYSNKVIAIPTWSLSDADKETKVTMKVDLTGFDKDKLVFYNYNKSDNKITTIKKPAYSVDKESKLTFTTNSNQGFVVVSNGALTLKTATTTSAKSSTVYWLSSGEVYHSTNECATLKRSSSIKSGTISESNKKRPCKVCN